MSRIGKQPIDVPAGVTVTIDPGRVTVHGPKGELRQVVPAAHEIAAGGRPDRRHAPDRARRGPRAARPDAHARREHGRGRHEGLREEARDPGRRLPRRARRAPTSSCRSATRTRCKIKPRTGIEFEVPDADAGRRPRHRQADGRPDRGGDPQGAPARAVQGQGHPLRGRVRPPEGRASAHEHALPTREARAAPSSPRARQGRRHRRAAAPRRVPLEPRHLRAARRRRRRPHARRVVGLDLRQVVQGRQDRAGRRGRQGARRGREEGRHRGASCSTAAATSTTDASRRSPTARAKED